MAVTLPPASNVLFESAVTVIVVVFDVIGVAALGLKNTVDFVFAAKATAVAQAAVAPVAYAAENAVPPSLDVKTTSTFNWHPISTQFVGTFTAIANVFAAVAVPVAVAEVYFNPPELVVPFWTTIVLTVGVLVNP
jgi:hypothetical protein